MSYSHSKVKPRPILKHLSSASDSSVDSSSASSSLSRASRSHVQVHFPSHPHSLSSTHDAYSASAYDRSPILVAPNVCALPARGCPGQTYGAAVDAGSDADSASLDDVYGAGACDVDDITSSTPGRGWAGERSGRARVRIRGFDMSRLGTCHSLPIVLGMFYDRRVVFPFLLCDRCGICCSS